MTMPNDEITIGSSQWWKKQSGLLTAIGTLVAILGLVFSVVTWLKPHPGEQPAATTGSPTTARTTTPPPIAMQRTPRMGLEFWQAKGPANIAFRGNDANSAIVDITLDGSPFEMRFPKAYAAHTVGICAWSNTSIFDLQQNADAEDHHCFGGGRGMADSEYGSGRLALSDEGFNVFAGSRVAQASATQDKIYISGFETVGASGTSPLVPIAQQRAPIYAVVWVDLNEDNAFGFGEYEYLVLNFS